jgi:RNA polymerase sigma-70 factor (ECF subfamily)
LGIDNCQDLGFSPKIAERGASNYVMVQGNSIKTDLGEVLAGCLEGNRSAQRMLYERFYGKVYGLAGRFVGSCEADDLTQEIFVRVFTGLSNYRGASAFSTWLYRVAINECLRHRRGLRPPTAALVDDPVSQEMSPGQHLEQAELLEHALQRLEAPLRAVFLLRHVEGLRYREISDVMGVSISTAATQLGRARAELQTLLRGIEYSR